MAATKAKELDNRRDGNRAACSLCQPRSDRVREDQVWQFALTTGISPWK